MSFFFFFNDTATTEIYTLSLHDALPICVAVFSFFLFGFSSLILGVVMAADVLVLVLVAADRSEEHTSELQSQSNLVCRLLLEKKKKQKLLPISCNQSCAS